MIVVKHVFGRSRRTCLGVLALIGVGAASLPAVAAAGEAPDGRRAVAIAAELTGDANRTKLVITVSKPVGATAFLLEKPDRAVIDLPDVNLQLDEARSRLGLVSALRFGSVAAGRSRIVVDLAAPASVAGISVAPGPVDGSALLTIEFTKVEREAFRKLVGEDRSDLVLTTGSIAAGVPEADRRPVIALDAGHGGTDPGARSPSGVQEKDITLAFAETLRDRLAASGRYRLLMIRDGDTFVPLDERVRRAREGGADLFLSIHADTISSQHVSGATIYTGSDRATDAESANLAARENAADTVGGLAGAPIGADVLDILQDLTLRETRAYSHSFSGLLLRDLGSAMRFSSHPQREASFRVLRTHDLPAVLVELGYMSNPRDLELLSSPDWRGRIAGRMATVVDRFFAGRPSTRAALSP